MANKNNFINGAQFAQVINEIKGCQFASIAYGTTTESMNKKLVGGKKNPYNGRLCSVTEMSGLQIGANYQNAVNNRTESKDFVAEKLPWGEWLRPNYLIGHKGETYLRAYKTKSSVTNVTYYLDGEKVEDKAVLAEIKANIRQSAPSARQMAEGIAEEDQVKPFTTNISNIKSATINGKTYVLVAMV